jgi:hypothetical protein
MQEAYDCADRDEPEAYNSIKVMCGEVLVLVDELIKAEREACAKVCEEYENDMGYGQPQQCANAIRARG